MLYCPLLFLTLKVKKPVAIGVFDHDNLRTVPKLAQGQGDGDGALFNPAYQTVSEKSYFLAIT